MQGIELDNEPNASSELQLLFEQGSSDKALDNVIGSYADEIDHFFLKRNQIGPKSANFIMEDQPESRSNPIK